MRILVIKKLQKMTDADETYISFFLFFFGPPSLSIPSGTLSLCY